MNLQIYTPPLQPRFQQTAFQFHEGEVHASFTPPCHCHSLPLCNPVASTGYQHPSQIWLVMAHSTLKATDGGWAGPGIDFQRIRFILQELHRAIIEGLVVCRNILEDARKVWESMLESFLVGAFFKRPAQATLGRKQSSQSSCPSLPPLTWP